ncbi:MFS transporter [Streptomyces boninensis]|uniref:MFS transporter n=1 Tax=Streptomyces boninensis TaxID=2039455 RepID=UPI003B226BBC
MTSDVVDEGAARAAALAWRGGFGRLFGAAVLSRTGDALRGAAMPLLAVQLTDSPFLVSLVTASFFLPWLVFGLLGGAVADRVDQRRAMWGVDALRGLLMAAFAVAVWQGGATIWLLAVVAFALTSLQTVFDNAATALLPAVVGRDQLATANARLMTGQEVAMRFIGAPIVPVLLGLGLAAPYAVDAVTFLLAAALVATVPVPESVRKPKPSGASLRRDIAEGLRVVWRDHVLRSICLSNGLSSIGVGALIATLVLHVTGWLGGGNAAYAAVITAYGIGSVAGGFAAARITARLGQVRVLIYGVCVEALALLCLGLIRELAAAVIALAVFGFLGMVWNVTEVTAMQQRAPEGMTGRVSAAFRTLSGGVAPAGALLGGVVAELWGLNAPAILAAALLAACVLTLVPAARTGMN